MHFHTSTVLSGTLKIFLGLVFSATKASADKDEDGSNHQEVNQELSPAETAVVSAHMNSSFQGSGSKISRLASAFSKTGSDKDEDGSNHQEEDQKLSPAETAVVSAHMNTSFQESDCKINGLAISAAFSKARSDKDEDCGNHQEEDQKLSPAETAAAIVVTHAKSSFNRIYR